MDKYIETMYVQRLGVGLLNFKQSKPRLWCFAHTCETDERGRRKRRAYIYEPVSNGSYNVKCHHCGLSTSFSRFLKENDPMLYDEYRLEKYKETNEEFRPNPVPEQKIEKKITPGLEGLIPLNSFSPSTPVMKYIERRKIPKSKYNRLYVVKDFYEWAKQFKGKDEYITNDHGPRLVLPYFVNKKLIGFTCRTFSSKVEPRYIHLRIDKSENFVYGYDFVDWQKPVYVTEGNIDSLFLDNAIAVGGASYSSEFLQSVKNNVTLIPDGDWRRNEHVAKQLKKAIIDGFKICFMPDTIKGKDVNDWVKNGVDVSKLQTLIDVNTKQGMSAQLEFAIQKRI